MIRREIRYQRIKKTKRIWSQHQEGEGCANVQAVEVGFEVGALVLERIKLCLAGVARPPRRRGGGLLPHLPSTNRLDLHIHSLADAPGNPGLGRHRRRVRDPPKGFGLEGAEKAARIEEARREIEDGAGLPLREALLLRRRHGRSQSNGISSLSITLLLI